ncbi:MAG: thioredoxin family protein [Coleofasciculaceae cyanobacterium RL_1_1]|nr:thioredoxin family protein [Coleofasciculaceae cyanobacterium RL_1_1]
MVRTPSTMLALGTPAPAFALPDVTTGATITRETFRDRAGLLVIFWCRHCPFVKHVERELASIGRDYAGSEASSLGIVAISSNDAVNYPDDAPESLAAMAADLGLNFPSCYDETQKVAQAYTAACTPDFFLFDRDLKLVYRGQLDDSRPGNDKPVTGQDLRAAIEALLAGTAIDANQQPSIGCNIKWQAGNAPAYFG